MSERHLAQLESGRGNISVVLLARIAGALQVDIRGLLDPAEPGSREQAQLHELVQNLSAEDQRRALRKLREWFRPVVDKRQRLVLVGFRGAGKSTLGAAAAAELGIPLVRVRDMVERQAGMNVSEIFSLAGDAGYRRHEERAVRTILSDHEHCVLETGGSLVLNPVLLELLLNTCFVVWIAAQPEEHMQRVMDQGDFRPMADHDDAMSDLRQMLSLRLPFYRQAHAVIQTSGRSAQECSAELVELFMQQRAATEP